MVVSRLFGAREYKNLKTSVYTTAIATAVLCAVLMIASFLGCDQLLRMMRTPESVMEGSMIYLDIYILGLPFVMFYNISNGIFSALGDSKTPFYFLAASSLSNIAVDILFVTAFDMGIAGVAWATFLCQGVSCILAVIVVLRRLKQIPTEGKVPVFSKRLLGEISKVAVPSILQQGCVSVGNIVIQSVINSFGAGAMAGYSAAVKLNNLVITSITTLGNGMSNFTAQNMGAGKTDRIPQGFRAGVVMDWIICLPFIALYVFCSEAMVRLFLDAPSADALHSGITFLRVLSPFYVVISCKLCADGVLRGGGRMGAFLISTLVDLALRVGLAVMFSHSFGLVGVWFAWPVGWFFATSLSIFFYLRYFVRSKPHVP